MAKLSIKAAVRDAKRGDDKARQALHTGTSLNAATFDSFVNFGQKLGIGADNALTSASYGYNPITRNRIQLEWIHRGSWLGGVAIDLVADDMTRAGVDFHTEIEPDDQEVIEHEVVRLDLWGKTNECIKWSRLYGGCIGVMLIDGQDPKEPLRLETVGPDQFRGIVVLDRWMVDPSLEDLVTDYGPHLGLPQYYRVRSNAPGLRGATIHYSRLAYRLEGVQLPHQQRMTENMWGISVLERLYDRMIAFDSASTGAAQLVYKSYLRTLKIPGLREIVAAGGPPMNGLMQYTEMMRRFQGVEGITLLDGEDEFEVQSHSAFSGLADALNQFGQQLSGALQIPLVRLFGQSPAGLNSTGDSDLRTYYDHIRNQQRKHMIVGVTTCYKLVAASKGIKLPDNFALDFTSLMELDNTEKAEIAGKVQSAVSGALSDGLLTQKGGMMELRQSSRTTGIFTNISQEAIEAADDEVAPPQGEEALPGDPSQAGGAPLPGTKPQPVGEGEEDDNKGLPGDPSGKQIRPKQEAPQLDNGKTRRVKLQQ